MSFFTEDRVLQGKTLEDMRSPLDDVLSADFREGWLYSPLSSLQRSAELDTAAEGPIIGPQEGVSAQGPFAGPRRRGPDTPILPAEEARKRVKDSGLDIKVPDNGISEGALNILLARKAEERKRQDLMNRAPPTWGIRTAASFAASALDPINIASAFIPVVGETRYAAMLARASGAFERAGVRAGVGAIEGAVGAAAVEPLVLRAASQEQADYTAADSLLAIVFGTVLGGGLHVTVGGLGAGVDWRTARAPEVPRTLGEAAAKEVAGLPMDVREQAMRSAIAQLAEGRPVDVTPVLDAHTRLKAELLGTTPLSRRQDVGVETPPAAEAPPGGQIVAPATGRAAEPVAEQVLSTIEQNKPEIARQILAEQRRYEREKAQHPTDSEAYTAAIQRHNTRMEALAGKYGMTWDDRSPLVDVANAIDRAAGPAVKTAPRRQIAAETAIDQALAQQRQRGAAAPSPQQILPLRQPRMAKVTAQQAPFATPEERAVSDLAQRAASDQAPAANTAADAITAAEADLARNVELGLVSKDDPELRALNDLTDRAEAEARAYEAAAFCLRRNG